MRRVGVKHMSGIRLALCLIAPAALLMAAGCAPAPPAPTSSMNWDDADYSQLKPTSGNATCGDDISNCSVGGTGHSGHGGGHR